MRYALAIAWLACTGCSETEGSLIDPDLWEWSTDDPFADDVSAEADCADDAWGRFTDYLDVDTSTDCDYLAVEQPSLVKVRAGRQVRVQTWHGPLTADAPAEGHLLLTLGDHVLLDYAVAIPADDTVQLLDVKLPETVPAGTPVRLHVHNHGDNSWAVRLVEVVPES